MKTLIGFGRFWYDFIVGDDWRVAASIVLLIGAAAAAADRGWNVWPLIPCGVIAALIASLRREVRVRRMGQIERPH